MVSKNPNPPEGIYMEPSGMAVPGSGANTAASTSSSMEDPNKKIRKPYIITKSRESWTDPEHDKFLEAIQLFDRDWKKIEAFIGSKTVIQIRSHAQKYFLKVQKSGTNEHLPPPRPKRKATHPYPQKASKNTQDSAIRSPLTSVDISSRTNNSWHTFNLSQGTKAPSLENHCCSGTERALEGRPVGDISNQGNSGNQLRVLPDFAKVYSFIGSVFDPNASDHLHKLKKMDQIDIETVLLLMRNLSINLTGPEFEIHRRLLESYEIEIETSNHSEKTIHEVQLMNVA